MFDSLGWGEIAMLLVIALFVLGPERVPGAAAELGRGLRRARKLFDQLTTEVREELGPELGEMQLEDLHPRRFLEKHLLEPDPEHESSTSGTTDAADPFGTDPGMPARYKELRDQGSDPAVPSESREREEPERNSSGASGVDESREVGPRPTPPTVEGSGSGAIPLPPKEGRPK